MTSTVEFFIPGLPVPFARAGGGKNTPRFTPTKQRNAMAAIKDYGALAMAGRPPFDQALRLRVVVVYPWPSSWSARVRERNGIWKTTKPDADNLLKLIKDALEPVIWVNDARIVVVEALKRYGEIAGVHIRVEAI